MCPQPRQESGIGEKSQRVELAALTVHVAHLYRQPGQKQLLIQRFSKMRKLDGWGLSSSSSPSALRATLTSQRPGLCCYGPARVCAGLKERPGICRGQEPSASNRQRGGGSRLTRDGEGQPDLGRAEA